MLRLGLVGCGGMGCRHIGGLRKLREIDDSSWKLVAVCDVILENGRRAADLADERLGYKPDVYESLDVMLDRAELDALIVTTSPDLHASVGIAAFERGLHVMVEKPIALTVADGAALIAASERSRRCLAVAENYRRDPINRLAKALLDAGAIGPVHLFVQSSSGSGERVIITPWRHRKRSGGIVVDMGIHYADLIEYFFGPVSSVFGYGGVVDRVRLDNEGHAHPVDAEDLSVGVARMESGAIVNWSIDLAGRGKGHFLRAAYGRRGSLDIPPDRTGRPLGLTLRKDGRDEAITPADTLALVPEFALDPVTAQLFGGERLVGYDLPFPDVDANLLAIEQADFAAAILEQRPPEVDGAFALRSLAIAYGFLEAELMNRPVSIDAMLEDQDTLYQRDL